MGQMRLAFPRGPRVKITCGHEIHYSNGMCVACYHRDYRKRVKEYTTAKAEARHPAPPELRCYNRMNGVCLGHPHSSSPTGTAYHE